MITVKAKQVTPDPKPVKVASISVTADKKELEIGGTAQAAAAVLPENADNKEVTWTSSNESAVTVNESGLIKAIGVGSADIIATAKDGSGVTGKVTITVKSKDIDPIPTPTPAPAEKVEELNKAVKEAESFKEADYTAESAGKLKAALAEAKKVLENKDATEAEVNAALKAVSDAKAALVKKDDNNNNNGNNNPAPQVPAVGTLVYGLTGLEPLVSGELFLCGQDITHTSIRKRSTMGMSHIPEDRHKHGLVLDYSLEDNMVLQRYFEPEFTDKAGFLRRKNIRGYAERLIEQYDVRSGQGPVTIARSMSGGNQQKAIVAREIDKDPELLVAVQPTRGLDVGAIEYIHRQLVAQRDEGKAVLLVSLELDEVMDVPDRILVMYEGEIVGELDPKTTTQEELGLYMAGAKRDEVKA